MPQCGVGVCILILLCCGSGLEQPAVIARSAPNGATTAEDIVLTDLLRVASTREEETAVPSRIAALLLQYSLEGDPRGTDIATALDSLVARAPSHALRPSLDLSVVYEETRLATNTLGEGPVTAEEVLQLIQYFGIGTNVVRVGSRLVGFGGVETKQDGARQLAARTNRDLAAGRTYAESLVGRIDRYASELVDDAPPRARPLLNYDHRLQLVQARHSVPPPQGDSIRALREAFGESDAPLNNWESQALELLELRGRLYETARATVLLAIRAGDAATVGPDGVACDQEATVRPPPMALSSPPVEKASTEDSNSVPILPAEKEPEGALAALTSVLSSILSVLAGTAAALMVAARTTRG